MLGLEPEAGVAPGWVLPLLTERVSTSQNKEMVGGQQIDVLLDDPQLPFGQVLTVEVGDSSYSKPAWLHSHRRHPNLVTIARIKSNRTLYHQFQPEPDADKPAGRPKWYGEAFKLSSPTDRPAPDETLTRHTCRRGKRYRVEIEAWHNLLMRGKRDIPMHRYPFTLVRITRYDEAMFKRPLWLLVMGQRRSKLTLEQIYLAYQARFDIEHFFRFGKQKLLMTSFQTTEVEREETWWRLTHLAYAQLWLARHLTVALPHPWERNLPTLKNRLISPALAQRGFERITRSGPVGDTGPTAQTPEYSGGAGVGDPITPTTSSRGGH